MTQIIEEGKLFLMKIMGFALGWRVYEKLYEPCGLILNLVDG